MSSNKIHKKNWEQKTDAWLSRYDFSNAEWDTVNTGHTRFKWLSSFLIKISSNQEEKVVLKRMHGE